MVLSAGVAARRWRKTSGAWGGAGGCVYALVSWRGTLVGEERKGMSGRWGGGGRMKGDVAYGRAGAGTVSLPNFPTGVPISRRVEGSNGRDGLPCCFRTTRFVMHFGRLCAPKGSP